MTRARQGKVSPLKVVTAILAVVVVALFVSAGFQINEHSKGYSYDYDIRDYIWSAENGRYGDLYSTAVQDMNKHAAYSPEVLECRALAFYCEQAALEHAYRKAGDAAQADEFAARMEEYEAELGSMAPKAEAARISIG